MILKIEEIIRKLKLINLKLFKGKKKDEVMKNDIVKNNSFVINGFTFSSKENYIIFNKNIENYLNEVR